MMTERNLQTQAIAQQSPKLNADLLALQCLRCDTTYGLYDPRLDAGLGCSRCLKDGYPSGLYCTYRTTSKLTVAPQQSGMSRFASRLPYSGFPTLGEGSTPLLAAPLIAAQLGIAQVSMKTEGQNPTGSHKDRMSPLAVARAISAGFSKVVASSSGNAGASLAAYAARAGIECCILATSEISPAWENAIRLTGSQLKLVEGTERWPLMQRMVENDGWFPVTNFWPTPIASNPFGIEGYKTIAHEIAEQSQCAPPTVVIVPTCRGDVLLGLWLGFKEAQECGLISQVPKLVAAEPGPRLEAVLNGVDYRSSFLVPPNNMTSIDGDTATFQSLKSLQMSKGCAVPVSAAEAVSARKQLAQNGFYVEMSSAASLAALQNLQAEGKVAKDDHVVLLLTSHGYKEGNKSHTHTAQTCN